MLFNKKRGLYSENPDVSKICATCKFGKPLSTVADVMCEKYGLVSQNHTCRHYDYNRLMKRPSRKRTVKSSDFDKNDFSID